MATKTIHINVGNCPTCHEGTRKGEIFSYDKRHNCNDCGYFNRYNQEMIEYNTKTMEITFSTIFKAEKVTQ